MKIKPVGLSAEFLKRKAKKLGKASRIPHTEALNLVAKAHGYESWEHFINNAPKKTRTKARLKRPIIPNPPVLNYHDFYTGAILGQHPNRKMTLKRHERIGDILRELSAVVEYHKRAKNAIRAIRIILDGWLGCEYKDLPNVEFNAIYYGSNYYPNGGIPSEKRKGQIKRLLRTAKAVLYRSYHDCKPFEKLDSKIETAMNTLDNWPKTIKIPGLPKGHLRSGTFVRLAHNKKIGLVFSHDTSRQVVEGYTDAGYFVAGRHEVSIVRPQPSIADFKPMRLYFPYGKCTCTDGREILFNRDYSPIWERSAFGEVKNIQPNVAIQYDSREFYYDDRTAPYYDNKNTAENCLLILKDWGVEKMLPKVFDLLPVALATGDVGKLSPKGFS